MPRRGFSIEIDPLYCDVIVERIEKLGQTKAVLEGDGRSFAEVRAERLGEPKVADASTEVRS